QSRTALEPDHAGRAGSGAGAQQFDLTRSFAIAAADRSAAVLVSGYIDPISHIGFGLRASSLLMLCAVTVAATALSAQSSGGSSGSVDPRLLSGLGWRNIGPFRGGRVSAVSGAIGQPGVF